MSTKREFAKKPEPHQVTRATDIHQKSYVENPCQEAKKEEQENSTDVKKKRYKPNIDFHVSYKVFFIYKYVHPQSS